MNLSNKTIVVLLSVAFLFTLISTIINLDRISPLGNMITGQATNTTAGTSTLTVASATILTLQVSTIAFGSGYVNTTTAGCDACNTATDIGPASGNDSCCSLFDNVTAGFLVENTGNENTTVNFTCSGSCTAATFINGTSPSFQFRITNSSNGVTDGSASNNSGDSITDTANSCSSGDGGLNYSDWTDMSTSGFDLCGSNGSTEYFFSPVSTEDAFIMDIRLTIPDDAVTGSEQTATITFAASSAG